VGDEDRARDRRKARLEPHDQIGARQTIDVAERFVEQQQLRPRRHRARQRDALRFAAGKRRDVTAVHVAQTHVGERVARPEVALDPGQVADREGDVADGIEMRKERRVLESEAERAMLGRDAHAAGSRHLAAEERDGAGGRRVEARDHAQQRGLAAARRSEDRDQLARRHVERHVGDQRPRAHGARHRSDRDDRIATGGRHVFSHGAASPSVACATRAAPAAAP